MIDHTVTQARARVDMADVVYIGLDETSNRRGHDTVTLFVDLAARRLLFATPGKDAETFARLVEDLRAHGGDTENIQEVSMDLSLAFRKGAQEHLSNAQITFDRFRLMKLVNEAVHAVRKGKVFTQPNLKKTRWLWLKNEGNLKARQKEKLQGLLQDQNPKTAQAHQLRLTFQEIFTVQNRHQGASLLKAWMENAKASGLPSTVKVVYTIMKHWDGILRWFDIYISNGILEGFYSLLQSAKSKARDYHTYKNFINMAYIVLGRLHFQLPT